MSIVNSKNKYNLNDLTLLRSEGLDEVDFQIFETPHPFVRQSGAEQTERYVYPGAVGIFVEFDDKCDWDKNADSLFLTSSFGNFGHFNHNIEMSKTRQPIASSYRLSISKVGNKKPLFMLGDHLKIRFQP